MTLNENMQQFLLAAYFGDVEKEGIEKLCVEKAYLDLARRIPYRYSISDIEKSAKVDEIKEFISRKEAFKKAINNCILEIKSDTNPIDIIEMVYSKANIDYSDLFDGRFFFGLSQKWVNMTLKYLWLFGDGYCLIPQEKLHVPLDSYIIHALTRGNKENKFGLNIKLNGLDQNLAWSTLDDKTLYGNIQIKIKETIEKSSEFKKYSILCPIEWENLAWIEQAKLEK